MAKTIIQSPTEMAMKLIEESRSFSPSEKGELLKRLPRLTPNQILDVIELFTNEKSLWAQWEQSLQNDRADFQNFASQSKHELDTLAKSAIRKAELESDKAESQSAEDLLNRI